MQSVIALVGRPNVGKSTLFNRLTRSRDALVADLPGLTRDRKYGTAEFDGRRFILIDTGGISGDETGIDGAMAEQSLQAIEEADTTLFLVDGRAGLSASDEVIATHLRQRGKRVYLVVNKTDGIDADTACIDFFSLGLGQPHPIAAAHGRGVHRLLSEVISQLPEESEVPAEAEERDRIKVAMVGRPNVGKSTLINRILGEDRVVVYDQPGTTRDSIFVPFDTEERKYTLIDTAGVRRRGKVHEVVEKFSIVKTLKAIEEAHVVIVVLDARQGVTDQDASLLGLVLNSGCAVVIAVNKWDNLTEEQKNEAKRTLELKLSFIDYAKTYFISALHGTGVGHLFGSVNKAYDSAMRVMSTPELTRILEDAVSAHQPPVVGGGRIKLRYAHQGGKNPPIIVIHGNRTNKVPGAYKRYLVNVFRKVLRLQGTPVSIQFKGSENPYKDKKENLTPRQAYKKKRLVEQKKPAARKPAKPAGKSGRR